MRRLSLVSVALASSALFALPPAETPPPKPLVFRAQARVEVDATGKLVEVGVIKDLPEEVRRYVAQELATWKFIPRPRNGETGNAATWLSLGTCAVPNATGGYSMGLAYHGSGPRITGGEPWVFTQGMGNVVSKYKLTGSIKVHFVVHPDGKAQVESIDGLDDARGSRLLRTEIEHMVGINHFEPEEIGGRPVATRGTLPLEFGPGPESRTFLFKLHSSAMHSPQCEAAFAAGVRSYAGLPVELSDSVIDIEPVF